MAMMMRGSPSFQCPAAASRSTTPRSCAAVTSASSSSGPRRTASSSSVHDPAPGCSAATNEYGHPGITCPAFFPRPCTWQNIRPGLVAASGRSQLLTSTASRIRPSGQAGNGSPATARRSRPNSARPAFSPSYSAPWPRPNSGTSDSRARSQIRPGPHSTASASENSASARRVKHRYNSPRNPASSRPARSSPQTPPSTPVHAILKATATAHRQEPTRNWNPTMTRGGRPMSHRHAGQNQTHPPQQPRQVKRQAIGALAIHDDRHGVSSDG